MILSIDLETRSRIDIKKCGVYKYCEDVEILLFGFAFDGDPVSVIDLTKEELPGVILEALYNPNIIKTAWNATFERLVLSAVLKKPIPVEQWECTQFMAASCGLSLKLGDTAKILGTSLKIDTRLINTFCTPDKNGMYKTSQDYPEKWEAFKEYCKGDVQAEREIREVLKGKKIVPTGYEKKLYNLDAQINDRGILVDMELVDNAIKLDQQKIDQTFNKIKEITGVENPNSVLQLKNYLQNDTNYISKALISRL